MEVVEGFSLLVREEVEGLLGRDLSAVIEKSRFSVVVGVLALSLPKSRALPGVRGVLFAEPNDAKAPDPRPNAEDAPVVGVVVLLLLSGLDFPPPALSRRLAEGKAREYEGRVSVLVFEVLLDVERESLPVLSRCEQVYINRDVRHT